MRKKEFSMGRYTLAWIIATVCMYLNIKLTHTIFKIYTFIIGIVFVLVIVYWILYYYEIDTYKIEVRKNDE